MGFKYEPHLCNGFHDLMQKTMNFNDVVIVSVKGIDHRIDFWYVNKDDAINIKKDFDLKKVGHYKFFSLYIKMGEATDYQRNREIILNRNNIK